MLKVEKKPFFQSTRWYHFVRSNYITWFTDWLMTLASKCTEVVLYVTVLYSCAELYPGVKLPDGLTLALFIIQMGALDIGGIGLSKMARQARADHNEEGAHKAEILSRWLISIMIASLVTASLTLAISQIPGFQKDQNAQTAIQIVQTAISLVLVVARAVCAVLYGKIIHALKSETPDTLLVPTKQADLEAILAASVTPLFQQVADLANTVQLLSVSTEKRFRQIESTFQLSIETALRHFQQFQIESQSKIETSFSEQIESLTETLQIQEKALSLLPDFTEQLGQIESVNEEVTQVKALVEQVITRRTLTSVPAASRKASTSRVVVSEAKSVDRKAFVFQCLTDDPEMKIQAIQLKAAESGFSISVGTISGYRNEFLEGRSTDKLKAVSVSISE